MNPADAMVNAVNRTDATCFLRVAIGAPRSNVPNRIAPPLDHGATGARLVALELAEMVKVEVPVPLLVSVTDVGLKLAVTFEAVPLVDVTVGVRVTVPA